MPESTHSPADLELFSDMDRAARAMDLEPCLIGAGAIQLGPDLRWGVRLGRRTRDWDFAVRVASWSEFEDLRRHLTAPDGGFRAAPEPHRFRHASGGTLDVVPYGALEDPPGRVLWSQGISMDTRGFDALDEHHCILDLGELELRVATLPALVGLKLLAYRSRRPGVTRDLVDVHELLVQVETSDLTASIDDHVADLLQRDLVRFTELGAFLLGRRVAGTFSRDAVEGMLALLSGEVVPRQTLVHDARGANFGHGAAEAEIWLRLSAFRQGLADV